MVLWPKCSARVVTRLCAVLALALCLAGLLSARANATTPPSQATTSSTSTSDLRLTAQSATHIADRVPQVERARRRYPQLSPQASVLDQTRWEIDYFAGQKEPVAVVVDDLSGRVTEIWTGPQAPWQMARGYAGAFGRSVNAIYIWVPLCLLFFLPFFDPRRPRRLLHLDLFMLLAFSLSLAFFNHGKIFASTPLVYPVLIYLLIRMLACGLRPRQRLGRLVPLVSTRWLALGALFLLGFRIALNLLDSNVIDVGYAGVIGAHQVTHGGHIYGAFPSDNAHGDTYGPFNYLAYVPFELIWPWKGQWDALPAAHAAAISFDVLTAVGLFIVGRQLARNWAPARRGLQANELGIALTYAWLSFPFSLYALSSNVDDSLIAMLVVFALVVVTSAPARGVVMALASGTKFAPLALVPLFATGLGQRRRRSWLVFGAVFLAVLLGYGLPFVLGAGPVRFFERTIGFQADRGSPFSIWGLLPALSPLHYALTAAAACLCALIGLVPRRRTPAQVAALGAAATLAIQLVISHWFYLYIVWFAPLVFVALFYAHLPQSQTGESRLRLGRRRERVGASLIKRSVGLRRRRVGSPYLPQ